MTTETPDTGGLTSFGVEQFVAQGVIVLHVAHTYRGVEIRKMRGTRHDTNVHRVRISDRGLVCRPANIRFRFRLDKFSQTFFRRFFAKRWTVKP